MLTFLIACCDRSGCFTTARWAEQCLLTQRAGLMARSGAYTGAAARVIAVKPLEPMILVPRWRGTAQRGRETLKIYWISPIFTCFDVSTRDFKGVSHPSGASEALEVMRSVARCAWPRPAEEESGQRPMEEELKPLRR